MADVLANFVTSILGNLHLPRAKCFPLQVQMLLILGTLQCIELGLIVAFILGLVSTGLAHGLCFQWHGLSFENAFRFDKQHELPDKSSHNNTLRSTRLRLLISLTDIKLAR